MSETRAASDEHAIREQAYYFWEQDGRPHGREAEYWLQAVQAVTDKVGKKPAKRLASSKLKAVASKTSGTPAKSAKPSATKPKKK
jgi:hypothetical protein